MSLSVITVTGMTCEHCEKAVRSEISAIPGVSQVHVEEAGYQLAESRF
jgi:copper chaperone